jgi:hypothetical protein
MDFCAAVLQRIPLRPRLLDIVDLAVFDFLIANADRHHFEVFKDVPNSALLFIGQFSQSVCPKTIRILSRRQRQEFRRSALSRAVNSGNISVPGFPDLTIIPQKRRRSPSAA